MGIFKKKKTAPQDVALDVGKAAKVVVGRPSEHTVEVPVPAASNMRQQCCSKENLKEQALLIATVAAVVIGILTGIALRGLKCRSGKEWIGYGVRSSVSCRRAYQWLPYHAG